jgi:hypothetical protein
MDLKFIKVFYEPLLMTKVVLIGERKETSLRTVSLEELMEEKITQVGSYFWDNTNRYILLGELQNKIDPSLTPDEYKKILGILKRYSSEIFESAVFTSLGEFYLLKESYGKKYPDYPPELDKAIRKRLFEKEKK